MYGGEEKKHDLHALWKSMRASEEEEEEEEEEGEAGAIVFFRRHDPSSSGSSADKEEEGEEEWRGSVVEIRVPRQEGWWYAKYLLPPPALGGFGWLLLLHTHVDPAPLHLRTLLSHAKALGLEVGCASVAHGSPCYTGHMLARTGLAGRRTDVVELLAPLFSLLPAPPSSPPPSASSVRRGARGSAGWSSPWGRFHARLLQPDFNFHGLGYEQLLGSVAGVARLGLVDATSVALRCDLPSLSPQQMLAAGEEAAQLFSLRFPHAPRPQFQVLEEVLLDPTPPRAVSGWEGAREAGEEGFRERVRAAPPGLPALILDNAFTQHMTLGERAALRGQLARLMLANHRSSAPLPVLLTQFHAHNFSFADEEEAEEEEEEDKWREGGPAAYWAVESTPVSLDTLLLLAHPSSSSSSSSSSSAVWDAVVKKGGIGGGIGGGGGVVYLSPDAPLALAPQDRFQAYVIGGVADKGRLVNASLLRAHQLGVPARALPLEAWREASRRRRRSSSSSSSSSAGSTPGAPAPPHPLSSPPQPSERAEEARREEKEGREERVRVRGVEEVAGLVRGLALAPLDPLSFHRREQGGQEEGGGGGGGGELLWEGRKGCRGPYLRAIYRALRPWRESGISLEMVSEGARRVAEHDPCASPRARALLQKGVRCVDIRGGFRAQVVNGSLHVQGLQRGYQTRCKSMLHLLLEALRAGPALPDVDLVVSAADHPLVPLGGGAEGKGGGVGGGGAGAGPGVVFSIAVTAGHADVPWPCFSFWHWPQAGIAPWGSQRDRLLAAARRFPPPRVQQLFWRGSDNGKYVTPEGAVSGKRRGLVERGAGGDARLNCAFTKSTAPVTQVPLEDHCRYAALANLPGETYSARLKYLLLCNSTILHMESEYKEFFEALLVPNKHFLPLNSSLHDLDHKVEWALRSRDAQTIAAHGFQFARECLRTADVLAYMRATLSLYASALTFKVEPVAGALRIRSHAAIEAARDL